MSKKMRSLFLYIITNPVAGFGAVATKTERSSSPIFSEHSLGASSERRPIA